MMGLLMLMIKLFFKVAVPQDLTFKAITLNGFKMFTSHRIHAGFSYQMTINTEENE